MYQNRVSVPAPYVGVAGFMFDHEIMEAISLTPTNTTSPFAIGILASAKTIRGIQNKYPNRYPKVETIPALAKEAHASATMNARNVVSVLHYSLDNIDDVSSQFGLVNELVTAGNFNALQVNAPPHLLFDPSLLACIDHVAADREVFRVIVQFRPPRGMDPWVDVGALASFIASRSSHVTDILLDASGGRGNPFNAAMMHAAIASIRLACLASGKELHRFSINVAGGLTQSTLRELVPLFSVHGQLGFDVESGVRDAEDHMSVAALRAYLPDAWALANR